MYCTVSRWEAYISSSTKGCQPLNTNSVVNFAASTALNC
eukprot:COSAG01_NODE_40_length_32708_cov_25.641234_23_plen_39_part_00